jgi:hypothetical protein
LRINFKEISKFVLGGCPTVLCFHVGSLDVGDAPASQKFAKDMQNKFEMSLLG